jgi:hypothetical protein
MIQLPVLFNGTELVGTLLIEERILQLYGNGRDVIFNPTIVSKSSVDEDGNADTTLEITALNAFVLPSEPTVGPKSPHLTGYIWECEAGHESYVSDIEMRLVNRTPNCPVVLESGVVCHKPLIHRLRLAD